MNTKTDVDSTDQLRGAAEGHLWRHFANMSLAKERPLKVMVKGDGSYLWDSEGNRYLDGLSNLFCVNVGYGYGEEFAEAAADQYRQLGYHSNWGTTHPRAIELAERVAALAPEGLNHVYFTPSGGESVEAAWKIAKQYYRAIGQNRWKAIARDVAYHGTTMGALSLIGVIEMRTQFEPMLAGVNHARNCKRYGRPEGETEEQFTALLLDDMEQRILAEDPDTVAMIIVEPVQNHGGMITPPAGYHEGLRALADKYGILLVADETITAWGRVGEWFASNRFNLNPDIITTAKGLSSAHAVIGAVIVSDKVYEPFLDSDRVFMHGNTFGGHPVMAAVALRNLDIMERLNLPQRVRDKEGELRDKIYTLESQPAVVDIRGAGFFWALELSSAGASGTPLTLEQKKWLYGDDMLAGPLEDRGVLLRISVDGGDPVLSIAPPLVADTEEFDLLIGAVQEVLTNISSELAKL